jgi:HlyD family secretion protein
MLLLVKAVRSIGSSGVWQAYVLGRAELRKLLIIRRSGRFAAVAGGVASGDVVIIYPSDRVADGVKVAPR